MRARSAAMSCGSWLMARGDIGDRVRNAHTTPARTPRAQVPGCVWRGRSPSIVAACRRSTGNALLPDRISRHRKPARQTSCMFGPIQLRRHRPRGRCLHRLPVREKYPTTSAANLRATGPNSATSRNCACAPYTPVPNGTRSIPIKLAACDTASFGGMHCLMRT